MARTVLVVEDNPDHAHLTSVRLSMVRSPWSVERADTLERAIARLGAGGVDAVLLDLVLPDARGVETVERLCGAHPDVPVVVLTNVADQGVGLHAVQKGAQDYLRKDQADPDSLDRALSYAVERHRADQAHARFAALVESSDDLIAAFTPAGTVASWNAAAARLTGFPADEALGRPASFLCSGAEAAALGTLLDAGLRGEAAPAAELTVTRRDGSPLPLSVAISAIRSASGRVTGASLIGRDVTGPRRAAEERERLIAQLQEALARIKTLKGLVPICASCKKVRDDRGYWNQIEVYLREHSEAELTHGVCPDCARDLYPGVFPPEG